MHPALKWAMDKSSRFMGSVLEVVTEGRIHFEGDTNSVELGGSIGGQFTKFQANYVPSITFDSNGKVFFAFQGFEGGIDSSSEYSLGLSLSLIKAYDVKSGADQAFGWQETTNFNVDLVGKVKEQLPLPAPLKSITNMRPNIGGSDVGGYLHEGKSFLGGPGKRISRIEGLALNADFGYQGSPVSVNHAWAYAGKSDSTFNYSVDLGIVGQAMYGVGNAITSTWNYFTPTKYEPTELNAGKGN